MILLLSLFFGLMLVGSPISFCMLISSIVYLMSTSSSSRVLILAVQNMSAAIGESFTIIAIPFFVLAGNIMNNSGITTKIFRFADVCVGWITGGLGHVNILASIIFSGMSGTAVADASGLGAIELKAMREAKYDDDFSLAITGASSIIGPIIPPSVPAVTFGVAGSVSIGALFAAGIVPGLVMGLALGVMVYFVAKKRRYPVRPVPGAREVAAALWEAFFPLLTPVILIGGISAGVFTPTEAAAVSVFYALALSFATRSIKLRDLPGFIKETCEQTVSITFIIATASIFAYILTIEQVPSKAAAFFVANVDSRLSAIILLNLLLFVVGMFMETMAALIVLTPVLLPVATAYGVQPVHFGIIMILNLMIGLLTPPVGSVLYVLAGLSKEYTFEQIAKHIIPYVGALVVVQVIVSFFPGIVLTVPTWLGLIK